MKRLGVFVVPLRVERKEFACSPQLSFCCAFKGIEPKNDRRNLTITFTNKVYSKLYSFYIITKSMRAL